MTELAYLFTLCDLSWNNSSVQAFFSIREFITSFIIINMEKTYAEVVVGKGGDGSRRWQVYQEEDETEALKIALQNSAQYEPGYEVV